MANCKINPALYRVFLHLKNTLGAEIVHRRRRNSSTCIEIIFRCDLVQYLTSRINTLKEAEKCGYWVICRAQSKRGHTTWHHHRVFQLFLTPVHPKKRHENQLLAAQNVQTSPYSSTPQEVTFEPIFEQKMRKHLHICKIFCTFAAELEFLPFKTHYIYESTNHYAAVSCETSGRSRVPAGRTGSVGVNRRGV